MNLRPLGYEPSELPSCSTPRRCLQLTQPETLPEPTPSADGHLDGVAVGEAEGEADFEGLADPDLVAAR